MHPEPSCCGCCQRLVRLALAPLLVVGVLVLGAVAWTRSRGTAAMEWKELAGASRSGSSNAAHCATNDASGGRGVPVSLPSPSDSVPAHVSVLPASASTLSAFDYWRADASCWVGLPPEEAVPSKPACRMPSLDIQAVTDSQ
jgi:hypothetical protein